MKPDQNISVVIPVYNEADVIESVIRGFYEQVIRKMANASLIIAEDGSTDGTKEILARLQNELGFILISGVERKGYTRAFKDALAVAKTPWVFFSDSDGQHDPADVFKMIENADGVDIVSGFKNPRRDPAHRLILSAVYNFLIGLIFGLHLKDIDSGFKLIRQEVIVNVLPRVIKMEYCVMSEFLLRAYLMGYKIKEVPVTHYPRKSGTTAIFHPKKLPGIVGGLLRALWEIRAEYQKK